MLLKAELRFRFLVYVFRVFPLLQLHLQPFQTNNYQKFHFLPLSLWLLGRYQLDRRCSPQRAQNNPKLPILMQKSYSLQDFLFQIIIQLLFIIFKFVMFTTLMANISEGEAESTSFCSKRKAHSQP